MAGDWRQQQWPLAALPFEVLEKLCNSLDRITTLTHSFSLLAAKLGYETADIDLFIARSRGNVAPISNSPTFLLLMDFADRGGTIQHVQCALQSLRHVAANIIPQNLGFITRNVSNHYRRHTVSTHHQNSGNQNTEYSICNCPRCYVPDYDNIMPPVHPNYHNRSYVQPPSYQSRQIGGGNGPTQISNGSVHSSRRDRHYPIDNNSFMAQQTSETSEHTMMSNYPVRSELPSEEQHRRCMETMCDLCRIRADPDETALFTVSNEKHQYCECSARNNPDERLALTSVFRQSPIGHTNTDDTSMSSHSSESSTSSNHDNILISGSRSGAGSNRNQRNPQQSLRTDASHGGTCAEADCRMACGGYTSKRLVKMHSTDKDRHSWPSSTSDNNVEQFRNCSSDSQLSPSRHGNTSHQQADLNRIQDTMYGRISLNSDLSEMGNRYHNNLDIDGGNAAEDDDVIEQNIQPSNSMNEVEDSQASASNAASRLGCQVISGRRRHVRVFFTYAWNGVNDSPRFLDELVQCGQQVKAAGAKVKIDMDERSYNALRLNKLDWIDKNLREADYIFVCITPTYQRDVVEPAELEGAPRASQLNTRYVYDQLRSEYFNNNSVNYRVIPILFRNFGTTETHVPAFMRTTVIYSYPDNINAIIDALFGRGRYRPS